MNNEDLKNDLDRLDDKQIRAYAHLAQAEIGRLREELADLKKNGVPGVMHKADEAFYRLAIKERDFARKERDRYRTEYNRLGRRPQERKHEP